MKKTFGALKIAITFVTVFAMQSHAEVLEKSGYRIDSQVLCDGLPQINVGTLPNTCVGILAGKQDGLKMPRYALQAKDGIIYVSEMGGWAFNKGTVLAVYRAKDNQGIEKTVIVDLFPNKKMTMPNGLAMDPEGRLYVGTPQAVVRFSPRLGNGEFNINADTEVVINDFAKSIFRKDEYIDAGTYNSLTAKFKNKHPLIQIATNKDFTEMYLNVGAPSDDCGLGFKTLNDDGKCVQSESPLANAAVWKVSLSNDKDRKVIKTVPFARGLRNSMALTVHKSGLVIQGENGIDLPSEDLPFEELNILEEGKHYGWPYCHSRGEVAPLFKDKIKPEQCSAQFAVPKVFMPAHTAPLGLLYYSGNKLLNLNNKLLVSWHGYQKYGQRVVAYPVNENGIPTGNEAEEIIFSWAAKEGIRPRGAPIGLTTLNDGSVLVVDDKNGALLRLSQGAAADLSISAESTQMFSEKSIQAFEPLMPFVKKNCVMCHTQFQKGTATEILNDMKGSMLNMSSPLESTFWMKLNSHQMPPEMIRSSLGFTESDYQKNLPLVEAFIKSLKP